MRFLLGVLVVGVLGCGTDSKSYEDLDTDISTAYHDAKDKAGELANDLRKYFADRGVTAEQLIDGVYTAYSDAKDYIGERANAARDWFYDRGLCEQRHGDNCNGKVSNGTDGRDGQDGKDGAKGERGANGADGAAGTNGSDGTNGNDGSSCSVTSSCTAAKTRTVTLSCTDGSSVTYDVSDNSCPKPCKGKKCAP